MYPRRLEGKYIDDRDEEGRRRGGRARKACSKRVPPDIGPRSGNISSRRIPGMESATKKRNRDRQTWKKKNRTREERKRDGEKEAKVIRAWVSRVYVCALARQSVSIQKLSVASLAAIADDFHVSERRNASFSYVHVHKPPKAEGKNARKTRR